MNSAENLQKGVKLYELRKYKEAEQALRESLVQCPGSAMAHAFLALAIHRQSSSRLRREEGLREVRKAISLNPYWDYGYYVLAVLCFSAYPAQALLAIQKAIRLKPTEAAYYTLLSRHYTLMGNWPQALQAARTGLKHDVRNVECMSLEALAQYKMARLEEAADCARRALALDPQFAGAHVISGWLRLNAGDAKGAKTFFLNALRLDPGHVWGREGLIESLRVGHLVYRITFPYLLFLREIPGWLRGAAYVVLYYLLVFLGGPTGPMNMNKALGLGLVAVFLVLPLNATMLLDIIFWLNPQTRVVLLPRHRRRLRFYLAFFAVGFVVLEWLLAIEQLSCIPGSLLMLLFVTGMIQVDENQLQKSKSATPYV